MRSGLARALMRGIQMQAEVESVTESSISVIGPIDLEELAEYLRTGKIELR